VLFVMAVMGGRVIPMFTNNGVRGAGAERREAVERWSLGSVLALWAVDALGGLFGQVLGTGPLGVVLSVLSVLSAALAGLAAAAHLRRWWLWQPRRTTGVPLVWVLHLAYLWIPLHLLLRAVAELGGASLGLSPSLATHALTVGAIGGLTIGMMTRTARGHTGRLLEADRWEVAAYALIAVAALLRVGLPLVWPAALVGAVLLSSLLWAAGMGIYSWRYWPILTRARIDGRPG
jgi:uncharacterized protein involved in response to NO